MPFETLPHACEFPTLVLLLPIVFMLHDFEELIRMRPWLRRQDAAFWARIPSRRFFFFLLIGGFGRKEKGNE